MHHQLCRTKLPYADVRVMPVVDDSECGCADVLHQIVAKLLSPVAFMFI